MNRSMCASNMISWTASLKWYCSNKMYQKSYQCVSKLSCFFSLSLSQSLCLALSLSVCLSLFVCACFELVFQVWKNMGLMSLSVRKLAFIETSQMKEMKCKWSILSSTSSITLIFILCINMINIILYFVLLLLVVRGFHFQCTNKSVDRSVILRDGICHDLVEKSKRGVVLHQSYKLNFTRGFTELS